MQDDKLLTQYARDGSEAAFGQLVARHLTLVYSTCLRETGSPSQAEDAAQVVFLLLARKAKSLRAGPSLAGWLYKAARFVAKDVRKQEARRRLREEAVMQEETRRSEPFTPEREGVEPLLNDALSALKPGEREAVLLRFMEGHTLAETGAALGLSEDAARMRVARAVEKMRRHLTARGATVTGVVLTGYLVSEAARPGPADAAALTQATLQAVATGPTANVLPLSKGVYQTMKIIKVKLAALAAVLVFVGVALVPLARALSPHKASLRVLTTPTPLAENVTKGFMLDKDRHALYSATLPRGTSMIILDARRTESDLGDMKVNLSCTNGSAAPLHNNTKPLGEVAIFSVSGKESRAVALSSLKKPKSLIFDIHNQGVQCRYWLTVLPTRPAVNASTSEASPALAVPRFGETLPKPMAVSEISNGRLEKNGVAYFVIPLSAGRYRSLLDFRSANGKSVDLNGEVLLSDEKGLPLLNEGGLPATDGEFKQINELHWSAADNQDASKFTVKKDGVFLITVTNQLDKPGGDADPVDFTEQIVSDASPDPKQN